MREQFDYDGIVEELANRVENMLTDQIEDATCVLQDVLTNQIEDTTCDLQDVLSEAMTECFSDFEFVLTDGTVVKPIQRMKLFSPDKSKLLLCYGGLRVDGSTLMIQTRASCWESIASYQNREEAIESLTKVKKAMDENLTVYEL